VSYYDARCHECDVKNYFLVDESLYVAFGQHLLSLAMSSIYHVILYLYPLPDFD
jgi:hypothetical protein